MKTSQTAPRRLLETGVLLSILALALFLRWQGLDDLGLWIDEDLTWIASHSIAENGTPVLPSGEVYARGLTYSYTVGAFVKWFGSSLTVLRLPSMIFSLLGILVVWFLAKRMGGPLAGILAAAVLAVSPWDFHYAQMARMYSLFGLLFTAGILWVYRGSFEKHGPSRIGALVVTSLLPPTHQLGAAMGLVYILPFFFVGRRRPWAFAFVGLAVLGVAMRVFRAIKASLRSDHVTDLTSVLEISSESTTFAIPFIPSDITLNHSSWIARDLWAGSTAVGVLVAGLLALGIALFALRRFRERQSPLVWICSLIFLTLLVFNQLILAALAGLYLLSAARHRATSPTTQRSFFCGLGRLIFDMTAALVLATLVLLSGKLLSAGLDGVLDRTFLRLFFALPVPFYRLLILQFPIMAAVVFLGGLIVFVRGLRPDAETMRSFVFLTFVSLLVLMGMFSSPYVINRYNVYLNGIFVALFAVFLTDGVRFVTAQLLRRPARPGQDAITRSDTERTAGAGRSRNPFLGFKQSEITGVVVLAIATVLLCEQFDPRQTWAATHRGYGYNRETLQDPDLTSHFRYDHGAAARFVLDHLEDGDRVAAKEPAEVFPYGLQCDFRVNDVYGVYARNGQDEIVDWYLAIPFLKTLPELRGQIEETRARGHHFWLICPREVEGGPAVHLPDDIRSFLAETPAAFTARDSITVVLRF